MRLKQATVTNLAMLVFGLIFVSFAIRGFGQLFVGRGAAMAVAGPVAVVAAGVLLFVLVFWTLSLVGITEIEREGE